MQELKIGFIGLGRMGLPMCYRLLGAGFDLTVHNRSQGKVQEIARAGAHLATSVADVTRKVDILLTCLPDIATVEELYLGDNGIIVSARPGQVLVDHSTVGVKTSRACAQGAETRGAMFLDAPISGGVERAAEGTLSIMAGGPRAAHEQVLPLFEAMGTTVRHIGPTGSGTTVKLINQLLVGIHSIAAAEAMALAAKSGADPALAFEVVNSGWGQSFILGRNAPAMLDREFEGIRTQIRVFLKDMGLVHELSSELGVPTPAAELAYQMLLEAEQRDMGDLDGAAIVKLLEEKSGVEVRRKAARGAS